MEVVKAEIASLKVRDESGPDSGTGFGGINVEVVKAKIPFLKVRDESGPDSGTGF